MAKKLLALVLCLIALLAIAFSWACFKLNNFEEAFNNLVNDKDASCIHNYIPSEISNNNYGLYVNALSGNDFAKVFLMGKKNNEKLIQKAFSLRKVNIDLCPPVGIFCEGDIAIYLFLVINKEIDIENLYPTCNNNIGVSSFWFWLNQAKENRKSVIAKLRQHIH